MGLPGEREAREYYRSARQRYEDAESFLNSGRTTGAVYLAGYGVECILKALVLNVVPATRRSDVLRLFRGGKAHDYEWLRTLYLTQGGAKLPANISHHFLLVNDWSTDLRYATRTFREDEAVAFLRAAARVMTWADGRL